LAQEAARQQAVTFLDGVFFVPLALEMAAVGIYHINCRAIAQEIERGLGFLATPMRDAPPRHHNIRAVFEHSWRLLTAEEQAVPAQLSVFQESFSLEAAQTITGATTAVISRLQEKFLLQPAGQDQRIRLHELLRQFAVEKLAGSRATLPGPRRPGRPGPDST
jgi:predicted ATPase